MKRSSQAEAGVKEFEGRGEVWLDCAGLDDIVKIIMPLLFHKIKFD